MADDTPPGSVRAPELIGDGRGAVKRLGPLGGISPEYALFLQVDALQVAVIVADIELVAENGRGAPPGLQ